jgi:hypothetical protein
MEDTGKSMKRGAKKDGHKTEEGLKKQNTMWIKCPPNFL